MSAPADPAPPDRTGGPDPARLDGLDLIRGGGMLIMVLYHGAQLVEPGWPPGWPSPWHTGLPAHWAVEAFFAMSGFLVGGAMLRQLDRRFSLPDAARFLARRWIRTLPPYWLALIAVWLLAAAGRHPAPAPDLPGLLSAALMLHTARAPANTFFPESWSLPVEEWGYLTLAAIGLAAALAPPHRRRAATLAALALWIALPSALRLATAPDLPHAPPLPGADGPTSPAAALDWYVRKVLPLRLDGLAGGLALALAWADPAIRAWLTRARAPLAGIGAALALIALAALPRAASASPAAATLSAALYAPLLLVGLPLQFPLLLTLRLPDAIRPALRAAADLSYCLYLCHLSIAQFGIISPALAPARSLPHALLALIGYLALSLILAAALHLAVERPLLRWRDRRHRS